MNSISAILTWPRSCDYPLWRQFLRNNRSLFNEVIITFMETNWGYDYRRFLKDVMKSDGCIFIDPPIVGSGNVGSGNVGSGNVGSGNVGSGNVGSGNDWRNISVNSCLSVLHNAQYIWFTEQDFFVNEGFWKWVNNRINNMTDDVICVKTGNRIDPCCIFMKTNMLNLTRKDFGVATNKNLDHFGLLQEDIERLSMSVAIIPEYYYKHMAGVSHNFYLVTFDQPPCYKADEFCDYLRESLLVSVPLHDEFIKIANKTIDIHDCRIGCRT